MALIKCDECGKEINDKAETCPNCGNPIKKTQVERVCEHCGGYVDENADVCVHCEKKLTKKTYIKVKKTNVCATLGFVFGVVAMLINPLALIGVTAIILSCIGSVQIKNNGEKGNGYAILGFLLGFISIGYYVYQIIQYEEMLVSIFS